MSTAAVVRRRERRKRKVGALPQIPPKDRRPLDTFNEGVKGDDCPLPGAGQSPAVFTLGPPELCKLPVATGRHNRRFEPGLGREQIHVVGEPDKRARSGHELL